MRYPVSVTYMDVFRINIAPLVWHCAHKPRILPQANTYQHPQPNGHTYRIHTLHSLTRNSYNFRCQSGSFSLEVNEFPGHDAPLSCFGLERSCVFSSKTVQCRPKDNSGRPLVKWAWPIGRLLVPRHDIDVNSKDSNGRTLLPICCKKNGHDTIVGLLLARHDINVNSKMHIADTRCGCRKEKARDSEAVSGIARHRRELEELGWSNAAVKREKKEHNGVILLLAREDIDVNLMDSGQTPLLL